MATFRERAKDGHAMTGQDSRAHGEDTVARAKWIELKSVRVSLGMDSPKVHEPLLIGQGTMFDRKAFGYRSMDSERKIGMMFEQSIRHGVRRA
jgi:hypothetical protein